MEFERLELLIGSKLNLFKDAKILLVGLGGVGGYALEALVRSGFQNIVIVDDDVIEYSNLNRQIITSQENIGCNKVDIAKERALSINPEANITALNLFLEDGFFDQYDFQFDYIIDACDSIPTKIYLIKYAIDNNVKIISCMGTGNRFDPSKLKIMKLAKTTNDPLAKRLRYHFRKSNYLKTMVVASLELPLKLEDKKIGTVVVVPMAAGNLCASYIINDLLKTN